MIITPYKFKARYYETDKMGIVHHSNYLRWFEEARVHVLDDAGISFTEIEAMGILSPVLSCSCVYKVPVRFDDTVIIVSHMPFYNGMRYEVTYTVKDENGTVHAEGTSSHCFLGTDMKPIRLQKKFPDIYDLYLEIQKTLEN